MKIPLQVDNLDLNAQPNAEPVLGTDRDLRARRVEADKRDTISSDSTDADTDATTPLLLRRLTHRHLRRSRSLVHRRIIYGAKGTEIKEKGGRTMTAWFLGRRGSQGGNWGPRARLSRSREPRLTPLDVQWANTLRFQDVVPVQGICISTAEIEMTHGYV